MNRPALSSLTWVLMAVHAAAFVVVIGVALSSDSSASGMLLYLLLPATSAVLTTVLVAQALVGSDAAPRDLPARLASVVGCMVCVLFW